MHEALIGQWPMTTRYPPPRMPPLPASGTQSAFVCDINLIHASIGSQDVFHWLSTAEMN